MLDGIEADPKVAVLGLGGVNAEAAIDALATAGHPGQFGNDQPGGTGFGGGEGQFVVGQVAGDSVEQFHCVVSWAGGSGKGHMLYSLAGWRGWRDGVKQRRVVGNRTVDAPSPLLGKGSGIIGCIAQQPIAGRLDLAGALGGEPGPVGMDTVDVKCLTARTPVFGYSLGQKANGQP